MKDKEKAGSTLWITIALLLLSGVMAASSMAGDLPKRKAGLWEMHTQMEGVPVMQPIQVCVDQASDNIMQQRAKEKPDCSTMDIKGGAGRTTVHAVCRVEGSTMTMDAVYTGSFESGYKSDMKMHYNPPVHGMSDTHMITEAKWLGACKPGQKPGDVIMPSRGNLNLNEMMKERRMKHQ